MLIPVLLLLTVGMGLTLIAVSRRAGQPLALLIALAVAVAVGVALYAGRTPSQGQGRGAPLDRWEDSRTGRPRPGRRAVSTYPLPAVWLVRRGVTVRRGRPASRGDRVRGLRRHRGTPRQAAALVLPQPPACRAVRPRCLHRRGGAERTCGGGGGGGGGACPCGRHHRPGGAADHSATVHEAGTLERGHGPERQNSHLDWPGGRMVVGGAHAVKAR